MVTRTNNIAEHNFPRLSLSGKNAQTNLLSQTFYLLTPPSKKAAHKTAVAGHPLETAHQPASSEGAAVRGEKFTGGEAAQPAEPVTDSEGTEASAEEIAKSTAQAHVRPCAFHASSA